MAELTPAQTVGPFFHLGLDWPRPPVAPGAITLRGQVLDGAGAAVPDALLECWDGDAAASPQRVAVDGEGRFSLERLKPPAARGAAPHLLLTIFARGLLQHLHTRVYFPEDAALHAQDPVLKRVPPARRATLLARRDGAAWCFDIHLQGVQETVFFDV